MAIEGEKDWTMWNEGTDDYVLNKFIYDYRYITASLQPVGPQGICSHYVYEFLASFRIQKT